MHHCRAARNKDGTWSTPIQGDKGFPDLVLIRERVVWAELKKMGANLFAEQVVWRDKLLGAGEEWYLWRPSDMDEIDRILR